jgi:hypothetical protein
LPEPVDVVEEINRRLANQAITKVELREGTLDLAIQFESGHWLEVIPISSGYEAWQISRGSQQFVAVGGGSLYVYDVKGGPPTAKLA